MELGADWQNYEMNEGTRKKVVFFSVLYRCSRIPRFDNLDFVCLESLPFRWLA